MTTKLTIIITHFLASMGLTTEKALDLLSKTKAVTEDDTSITIDLKPMVNIISEWPLDTIRNFGLTLALMHKDVILLCNDERVEIKYFLFQGMKISREMLRLVHIHAESGLLSRQQMYRDTETMESLANLGMELDSDAELYLSEQDIIPEAPVHSKVEIIYKNDLLYPWWNTPQDELAIARTALVQAENSIKLDKEHPMALEQLRMCANDMLPADCGFTIDTISFI